MNRTRFAPGAGFALDQAYRLAHLPLVAPHHPKVIAARPGTAYDKGRHPKAVSLVLPVPDFEGALDAELQAEPFARKIAWDIVESRRGKLHATLGGSPPVFDRATLSSVGPITVELRGLFSGTVNHGRLYLRAYPEKREGENQLKRIQRLAGLRETGLYLVGKYNFTDDLDAKEAAALAALIDRWWDRPILRWQVDTLWLLAAWDDLVLDGSVEETISLSP